MVRHFVSAPAAPRERGLEFGQAHAREIARNAEVYAALFAAASEAARTAATLEGRSAPAPIDMEASGAEALAVVEAWWPEAAAEIAGIADGAGLPHGVIAALNARTEILARCGAAGRGECSAAVVLGAPPEPLAAGQTWDWHEELAGGWLVWTIEQADGSRLHTLTEFGVLGKIGVNTSRVGLLLNILHHTSDGGPIGVPVHLIARRILETAGNLNAAVALATSARTSASSALTLVGAANGERSACTVELTPDGPGVVIGDERGVLLHTNHFLSEPARWHDREPVIGPDSFLRFDVLRRRFAGPAPALLDAFDSHFGGAGGLCAHPAADAPFGERYATLATILLDVEAGGLTVHAGGPCTARAAGSSPLTLTAQG